MPMPRRNTLTMANTAHNPNPNPNKHIPSPQDFCDKPTSSHFNLYKSITADTSQVCDGRPLESLSKLRDESQLDRDLSSNNLCVLSHTVSCNDDNCEASIQSHVFNAYRPVSRKTKTKDEGKLVRDDSDRTKEVVSPDNVISILADAFANLSRQPPMMPFDNSRATAAFDRSSEEVPKSCINITESSPLQASRRKIICSRGRSMSMPFMSDLEMWKTDQSHLLSPPVKQLKLQQPRPPSTPDKSKPIPESNGYQTPPTKVMIRKKSTPQHRSPHALPSIMKTPKYSPGVVSFLHSGLDEEFDTKSRSTVHERSKSMPPMGPLPDVPFGYSRRNSYQTESVTSMESNDDGWLPKGVDFKNSAEVYIFKKYQG